MSFGKTSGTVVVTSSGALISSGKPVRVFNVTSTAASTSGTELYNGTSKTGTARVSYANVAGRTTTVNFQEGMLFPDGCYVVLESGTSQAVLECRLES